MAIGIDRLLPDIPPLLDDMPAPVELAFASLLFAGSKPTALISIPVTLLPRLRILLPRPQRNLANSIGKTGYTHGSSESGKVY